jgi:hypothetical protein
MNSRWLLPDEAEAAVTLGQELWRKEHGMRQG